jgi:hypothetical protein
MGVMGDAAGRMCRRRRRIGREIASVFVLGSGARSIRAGLGVFLNVEVVISMNWRHERRVIHRAHRPSYTPIGL